MKATTITIALGIIFLVSLNLASAVTLNSVTQATIYPGEEGKVTLNVENIFNDNVQDVSVTIKLDGTSFITSGGSVDTVDEIKDGDDEDFSFKIKAATSIKPGDYNIPYIISYTLNDIPQSVSGTFGITVGARTELSYSVQTTNNVVGQQGKVSLVIVNSGLGDIGFVDVKFISVNGIEILSDSEEYIGIISSDDYETATVDVLFQQTIASFTAIVSYKDSENNPQTKTLSLPVSVYSREKALELGLITKNNYGLYAGVVILLIVIWFVWRAIRKAGRKRKLNAGR